MLTPWSKVGIVEPSHFDPGLAFAAVDRHRLDDARPYLYRTRDGGHSWTSISDGLALGDGANSVNVVREDPVRPGLVYAGTERGAFVSFDDGDHWQPLQRDLPRTSVRDITLHGDDLVIATHGRGFYIMDDITPLRALATDAGGGARLFQPAPAIRLHGPPFTGTPLPKDEPIALNPPNGAYIDYVVPEGVAGPVQISVLDGKGALVRRFSSGDPDPEPDLGKIDAAPEWLVTPKPPSAAPGQHRFVWNLRYAAPTGFEGADGDLGGIWAPPGLYTVELTVGGRSLRQPLEVRPDPRVKLEPAAFQAEFALARRIEQAQVQVHSALVEAKALRTQLQTRLLASPPPLSAELERLEKRLNTVADLPVENPRNSVGAPPQSLDGLNDIAQRLDKLSVAVDGADGAPTADDISGFRKAGDALTLGLAHWAALKPEIVAVLSR